MKYKAKPIDYTGCNPIIAEHLQRGEAVLCKDSDGRKCYVTSYETRSPAYRVMLCDIRSIVWRDNIEPIPTIQRIMPAERAIPVLIAEEWKFDGDGNLHIANHVPHCFPSNRFILNSSFRFMGETLESGIDHYWPDCIIEDVDE